MNFTVIGVGDDLVNAEDKLKEIAGNKGTVHLYNNFSTLASYFDTMSAAVCGELLLEFHFLSFQTSYFKTVETVPYKTTVQIVKT